MRHHLLAFTSALGGGGAEKHLVRVLNHLDRDRFRVSLAVARGGGAYESELAPDIRLHVLGTSAARCVWKLAALIDHSAPTRILSVMDHANCVALAASALSHSRAPVVVGVQIPFLLEARNNPHLAYELMRLLIPGLYRRAAAVIALSNGVRDELGAWLPWLNERIHVVHNAGWDERMINGADAPIAAPPSDGPIIVACGRLIEQKGFEHLLEAMVRVRHRHPARLWILGEGPLRKELEGRARSLGLDGAVWFAGFQNNPYAYMKRGALFVLSSLWEGFANVVVEAMALGIPVVATDCPHGPGEIIRDERDGVLVPPGNSEALADAMIRVLDSDRLRDALSRGARTRAQDFSAPRIAARYAAILTDADGATRVSTRAAAEAANPL
jgi:glycosyltransferase involved in cell wall biosynthesis